MNGMNAASRQILGALAAYVIVSGFAGPGPSNATEPPQRSASPVTTSDVRAKSVRLPAVAEAVGSRVAVRSAPKVNARRIATMKAIRFDFRRTVFFVTTRIVRGNGGWYRVKVPGRPNGRSGWVPERQLRLLRSAGPLRIVIDRSRRQLVLKRGEKTVMDAPVAVGKSGAPTPLGRFYVTAKFAPSNDFLGPWAFELSAYAAITDWPRGGIVGLHGTSEPWSIGSRASSGCIRTYNWVIRGLRRKIRDGTVVRIKA